MKDEIKEILDTFKWSVEQPDIDDEQLVLTGDLKKLLDYITNLQEEIKSLKGSCKALGKKRENQRKELIVLSHNLSKKNVKVQTLKTNMKELQQENERLQQENFNIRENIHIEKISLPKELIKDKNNADIHSINDTYVYEMPIE